jgi:hypothetical protein
MQGGPGCSKEPMHAGLPAQIFPNSVAALLQGMGQQVAHINVQRVLELVSEAMRAGCSALLSNRDTAVPTCLQALASSANQPQFKGQVAPRCSTFSLARRVCWLPAQWLLHGACSNHILSAVQGGCSGGIKR